MSIVCVYGKNAIFIEDPKSLNSNDDHRLLSSWALYKHEFIYSLKEWSRFNGLDVILSTLQKRKDALKG